MRKFFTLLTLLMCVGVLADAAVGSLSHEFYVTSEGGNKSINDADFFSASKDGGDLGYFSRDEITYNDKTLSDGLKLESKTKITFTPTGTCTITIVQSTVKKSNEPDINNPFLFNEVSIDDIAQKNYDADKSINVYTLSNQKGQEYTITRSGNQEAGILYILVEEELSQAAGSKVWDFSKVRAMNGTSATGDGLYSDLKKSGVLTYNDAEFDGSAIRFYAWGVKNPNHYPIKENRYAENGSLEISPSEPGAVRVTFECSEDIETTETNTNPVSTYISIGYSTGDPFWDDDIEAGGTIITDWIPVEAKAVLIHFNGKTVADGARVSKVEYVTADGTMRGNFTTQEVSGSGMKSKWTYGNYKNGVHGLVGGVLDNGIWHLSRNTNDPSNDNGNIKFSIRAATDEKPAQPFLSCTNGSTIYVPVPPKSSGDITVVCTDNKTSGTDIRWFDLYKNGVLSNKQFVYMQKDNGYKASYTSDQITEYKGNTYLELHDDGGEMKVLTINVELKTSGALYQYTPPVLDYDHTTIGEHEHAVFSYDDGDLVPEVVKDNKIAIKESTLTLESGAELYGDAKDDPTVTYPIQSFNSGDLVIYKNDYDYYGALQLRYGQVVYTITAPSGKLITSSIKIHGYTNLDDSNLSNGNESYVSNLFGGKFTDTTFDYPRDAINAQTTTLDFEVTADESFSFQLGNNQFFGIIDAVYVDKKDVPVPQGEAAGTYLEYKYKNGEKVLYLASDVVAIDRGGTITYNAANPDQELWWYFRPVTADAGSRGNMGSGDYKTFSVKNYPFVNVGGVLSTEDLNGGSFFKINAPKPKTNKAAWNMMREPGVAEAAETAQEPLELTVEEDGYFYFYIKDNATGFNSKLVTSGFGLVTGIEEVEIDAVDPEAVDGPMYNVYGQRVDESYRGLVIKNGRKYINR
ncbi:MAG: hypothetical protein J1E84_00945 [Muribaculaceae bacterium]|nr:hypothetical protein [Muribaculaceae bacterium]